MSKINPGLYTSSRGDYETPPDLFAQIDRLFDFHVDVCADERNSKCNLYYTKEKDGLKQDWHDRRQVLPWMDNVPWAELPPDKDPRIVHGHIKCWMNPPYGRHIPAWVEKAHKEWQAGAEVVGLVPARTDTLWWRQDVKPAPATLFLKGRLAYLLPCIWCGTATPRRGAVLSKGGGGRKEWLALCKKCYETDDRWPPGDRQHKGWVAYVMGTAPFPSALVFWTWTARNITALSHLGWLSWRAPTWTIPMTFSADDTAWPGLPG